MLRFDRWQRHLKATASALLIGGMTIAVAAPTYGRHELGYGTGRGDWMVALWQTAPYLLCSALWLPWRSQEVKMAAVRLSLVILLGSLLVYIPILVNPRWQAGENGLAFAFLPLIASAGVLMLSAVFALHIWLGTKNGNTG
jgi:hypothetical protein